MNWWGPVFAMEVRKILAYRSDFWVTFLGHTFIQLLVARALWQNVFESQGVTTMQGYSLEVMTLYYLIVPVGNRMLTGQNIGFISREIYDGTFTRYLIYPLSIFQYKTITYMTYSLFYGLQLILLYSGFHLFFKDGTLGHLNQLMLGTGLFLLASMVYVMMAIAIELLALWADNIWSLVVMLRFFTSFLGGGFIPLEFFPDQVQSLLNYTPFPYLLSLPIKTILGRTTTEEILVGVVVMAVWTFVFGYAVKFIWKVGQKEYAGVGQ